MGCCIYYITKAPIGWSLFRDRERLGGHGSFASALEAVTKACTIDISEDREVQINVKPGLFEIEREPAWPLWWPRP